MYSWTTCHVVNAVKRTRIFKKWIDHAYYIINLPILGASPDLQKNCSCVAHWQVRHSSILLLRYCFNSFEHTSLRNINVLKSEYCRGPHESLYTLFPHELVSCRPGWFLRALTLNIYLLLNEAKFTRYVWEFILHFQVDRVWWLIIKDSRTSPFEWFMFEGYVQNLGQIPTELIQTVREMTCAQCPLREMLSKSWWNQEVFNQDRLRAKTILRVLVSKVASYTRPSLNSNGTWFLLQILTAMYYNCGLLHSIIPQWVTVNNDHCLPEQSILD